MRAVIAAVFAAVADGQQATVKRQTWGLHLEFFGNVHCHENKHADMFVMEGVCYSLPEIVDSGSGLLRTNGTARGFTVTISDNGDEDEGIPATINYQLYTDDCHSTLVLDEDPSTMDQTDPTAPLGRYELPSMQTDQCSFWYGTNTNVVQAPTISTDDSAAISRSLFVTWTLRKRDVMTELAVTQIYYTDNQNCMTSASQKVLVFHASPGKLRPMGWNYTGVEFATEKVE